MPESGESPRILCVDDEPNVLEGLERTLFERFDVSTAGGGAQGLEVVNSEGPFAVVVSDMRMPGMDGATFLAQVRRSAPDTVRILLTGQADLTAAIAAVNEASIFRYLCKPCPRDTLVDTLQEAVEHYRLTTLERELLDKTLKGAVKVLADVLSLASPGAFSRSNQIKAYVTHMARRLGCESQWQFEVAAMLCQMGCITLPPEILDKAYVGQPISKEEQRALDEHPEVAYRLLSPIPRLEEVAAMIRGQNGASPEATPRERLGGEMLRAALAVDRLVSAGASVGSAADRLKQRGGYDRKLLDALDDFQGAALGHVIRAVRVRELRSFMVLDEDVCSKIGYVLVGKDRDLNPALIERLANFQRGVGVKEPIRVRVPGSPAKRREAIDQARGGPALREA